MVNPARKSHLRLVFSTKVDNGVSASLHENGGIGPDDSIPVWMVSESVVLRDDRFISFLEESRTRCLFDVRIAPRMDFIAPSRVRAFKRLADLGVDYVDVFGVLNMEDNFGVGIMPEKWTELLRDKLSALDALSGMTIIFDNEDIMRRAQYVLPAAIAAHQGSKRVRVEILSELPSELIAL